MNFSKLSDEQLLIETGEDFMLERKTTHRILLRLREIQTRLLYAKRGYPSMFTMLIKHFKQSETSANQRLKALELMTDVPLVEERILTGDLNLSTLAMAQRQINRNEKITGKPVSKEKKVEIVEAITGKTMAQAEIELFKNLPETAWKPEETQRRVSEDTTRMGLNFPDDVMEMLNRLKDRWAHIDPKMENVEVIRRAFKIALRHVDPTERKGRNAQAKKSTTPPPQGETHSATETAKHRSNDRLTYYGKDFDAALWERAGSRCEWIDDKTGKRCECTFGLEREHVISLATGGTNELSNMQLLCKAHNLLRARSAFGNEKIDFHQKKRGPQRDDE